MKHRQESPPVDVQLAASATRTSTQTVAARSNGPAAMLAGRESGRATLTDPHRRRSDLERAARGEADAVRAVLGRTGPWVHGLVRARVGDRPEVVVAIYERLWRECAEYDPDLESELVFVARIARRELVARGLRSETSERAGAARASAPGVENAGAAPVPCHEGERLAPFLARLSPDQMSLLRTALHEGRDPSAPTDGKDESARRDQLRGLLLEARRSLRATLGPEERVR